jgi:hypothetical protein
MKYAHIERERRFLLASVPAGLGATAVWTVVDRYLPGTGLRLRLIVQDGQPPVRKLGQKIRLDPSPALTVAHTSMYLSEPEYAALARLAANQLRKTRYVLPQEDGRWLIDAFEGELEGLVTMEIDLGDDRPMPTRLPLDALVEVTDDDRFTGGQLARTDRDDLQALLAEYRV